MPCNDKYGWCTEEKIVHIDGEREYCVFHAPVERKGITTKEFNELIFARIDKAKAQNEKCRLSGTIFLGDIFFGRYGRAENNPLPDISFAYATFNSIASFSGAEFGGMADFGRVKFNGKANLFDVRFNGKADFSWAEFNTDVSFFGASFDSGADFVNTKFGKADFYLATFGGKANFVGASFGGEADFSLIKFNEKSVFLFKSVEITRHVLFRNVAFQKPSFMRTDLLKCQFIACQWNEKNGRYLLHDETEYRENWENRNIIKLNVERIETKDELVQRIRAVEDLYRTMKQKARAGLDEFAYAHWHFSEKEMQLERTTLKEPFQWAVLNAYKHLSGFGEDPKRAFIVLLLIILVLSGLFGFAGIKEIKNPEHIIEGVASVASTGNVADLILSTFQYAIFEKDPSFEPLTRGGQFLKFMTKLIIPLQAAFFALALRNRFRR